MEELAGKNRSNIAASILSNPELLEKAYNRSTESEGVAQQELDTYLQSYEAYATRLQNSLQELATTTIDIGFLKDITSLATGAVEGINSLSNAFGGLNVVIGTVAGILETKLGGGFLNFNSKNGFSSPFLQMF